jgi:hypothetical protein
MTKYEQDFECEENKDPNHIYLITANTRKINQLVVHLLNKGIYSYNDDENLFILNERFRWYAPGTSDVRYSNLISHTTYLNCASSVMIALALADIDKSHIQSVQNLKKLQTDLLKELGELSTEHAEGLYLLSQLSKVILPQDIVDILNSKTEAF